MYAPIIRDLKSNGFVEVLHDRDMEEIGALWNAARVFVKNDRALLEHQASERALCHRLALYLEQELEPAGYPRSVDCEYNRVGTPGADDRVKRLQRNCQGFAEEERRRGAVFPDIIVHERGTEQHNRLVVEAKLSSALSEETLRVDLCKLRTYVAELNYRYAAFVLFEDGIGSAGARVFSWNRSSDVVASGRV